VFVGEEHQQRQGDSAPLYICVCAESPKRETLRGIDLIDQSYMDTIKGETKEGLHSMSPNDMLTLICNNLLVLETPILIIGKNAYHYQSAYSILETQFNISGVSSNSSANVEEKE
jgi:hypothetical protein